MTPKKSILIFAVIVFSLIFCGNAFSKNKALEKERLKMKNNKISVMNEFLFFPKTNSQKKKSVQSFDENGNKISIVELDNEEKQIKKIEYTYDSKNNESSFTEFGASGEIKQKCINKYDPGNDFLIEEQFYNAGNVLVYRRMSKPDKFYNIYEQFLYDKNGKLLGKSSNKYDNAGNRIEAFNYDAANNFNGRYVYNYDKAGNLIETVTYDKNNKFAGKKINNYDQKGLLTETIGYNAAGAANSWRKFEYEFHKNQVSAVNQSAQPATKDVLEVKKTPENVAAIKSPEPVKREPVPLKKDVSQPLEAESAKLVQNEQSNETDDYANPNVNTSMTPSEIINLAVIARPETVKGLAEFNSMDLNAQNERGQTALMLAVVGGNEKMVEFLLNHGVDLKIKDVNGFDVLFHTKATKNNKVKEMIKNHYSK